MGEHRFNKIKRKKIQEKVNEPNHINWKAINSTSQECGRIRTKSIMVVCL